MSTDQKKTLANNASWALGGGAVMYAIDKATPVATTMAETPVGQGVLGAIIIVAILSTAFVLRDRFPRQPNQDQDL